MDLRECAVNRDHPAQGDLLVLPVHVVSQELLELLEDQESGARLEQQAQRVDQALPDQLDQQALQAQEENQDKEVNLDKGANLERQELMADQVHVENQVYQDHLDLQDLQVQQGQEVNQD